ncbi:hypothetical protein Sjap_024892 [Stephania japonica]|uniref:Uncharacterized protein n=1 Tax=Stephania japonica TaxID=461633 RepID=A0AAP0EGD6_9MAGN
MPRPGKLRKDSDLPLYYRFAYCREEGGLLNGVCRCRTLLDACFFTRSCAPVTMKARELLAAQSGDGYPESLLMSGKSYIARDWAPSCFDLSERIVYRGSLRLAKHNPYNWGTLEFLYGTFSL